MSFPGAELLTGAFDLAGNAYSAYQNKKMAREQMAFQERMSNTAYQRAMSDMKKAGINPMLSVMKGSGGASSPSGATSTMDNPAEGVVASALSHRRANAEIELLKAQTEKTRGDWSSIRGKARSELEGSLPAIKRNVSSALGKTKKYVENPQPSSAVQVSPWSKFKNYVENPR